MYPVCAGIPSESEDRWRPQWSDTVHTRQGCDAWALTNRFSITLTSSLTWLRIFLQHSALCWILSFSTESSVEQDRSRFKILIMDRPLQPRPNKTGNPRTRVRLCHSSSWGSDSIKVMSYKSLHITRLIRPATIFFVVTENKDLHF